MADQHRTITRNTLLVVLAVLLMAGLFWFGFPWGGVR